MLDFPASPSVGQKFPSSPIVGIPSYTWDGEKWTTAVGTASGGLAVLYDKAQSLTALNQQQARQNIYAAPFDAMAYGGLQINGGFEVSQEKGAAPTTTNGYICDGWLTIAVGTMVISATASSAAIFAGFPCLLSAAVQTAQASLGSGDFAWLGHYIEGYRIARLGWGTPNAQPITIGFWTAHHRAGLYSVSVRNGNNTRSYVATYTQAVADVPQYNTVTIPGDTSGTWAVNNTLGLYIAFTTACGATNTASSANTWLAGNYLAAPGQINAVAATTDAFRLTGVIVLPGNEAPSAARSPFVMRPYGQELEICKRYFQFVYFTMDTNAAVNEVLADHIKFSPEMRATPSLTMGSADAASATMTVPTFPFATNKKSAIQSTALSAARAYVYAPITADARL